MADMDLKVRTISANVGALLPEPFILGLAYKGEESLSPCFPSFALPVVMKEN
jgi:hypothetical protein